MLSADRLTPSRRRRRPGFAGASGWALNEPIAAARGKYDNCYKASVDTILHQPQSTTQQLSGSLFLFGILGPVLGLSS